MEGLSLRCGRVASVEGSGEHQIVTGVTEEHAYCWFSSWEQRTEFSGFGKVMQRRIVSIFMTFFLEK
jgi:hypothetical protein